MGITRTNTIVKVDLVKLERLRESLGLNHAQFGESIGHEKSWYSGVKSRSTMKRNDLMLIKSTYGVDVEAKNIEPQVAQGDSNGSTTVPEIDYDKLAEIMGRVIDYDKLSDAMYRAMVKALEGDKGDSSTDSGFLE